MATLRPRIQLSAEEHAQLAELSTPAAGVIGRLERAIGSGNRDREEIRDDAFRYRAALVDSSHPDARAWGEALHFFGAWVNASTGAWYAQDDFMREFGLDPSTTVTKPVRTEQHLDIHLDDEDHARLAARALPGDEDESHTLTRLLGHALDGMNRRRRAIGHARAMSIALANHPHPDAASWAQALEWFADKTSEGHPDAAHDQFVRHFDVDPPRRRRW